MSGRALGAARCYNGAPMSDPAPLDAASPPPTDAPNKGLRIIFFIVMMDLFGFGIIIPLLPFYVPGYNEGTISQTLKVTILFSLYSICQFIGAPILGVISDRIGRKPVLALSQVGSAIGYLLLGLATQPQFHWTAGMSLAIVYVSRVLDGFTGGNISTAQAYISDVTTPEKRGKAMALLGAAFGIGFVFGPMTGGILGHYNASLPAYAAVVMASAAGLVTWLRLPESRARGPVEDEVWLHPRVFVPILRKPIVVQILAVSFFTMAAFVMMESTMALYLDGTFGWNKLGIGLYFCYLGFIIAGVQGGFLSRMRGQLPEWPLAIAGPLLVALGMIAFTGTGFTRELRPELAVALLFLGGAVNATGRSVMQPALASLISKFSDPDEQGTVFGLYHGLGSLARVAGPLIAAPAYILLRHTGQFITAGAITVMMALWMVALKAKAGRLPAPGALAVPPTAGEAHAVRSEPV